MKIDTSTINTLLKMNDDRLWNTIKFVISRSGSDVLKNVKRPDDMSKLRSTLSEPTNEDINRAIELLKSGEKNGR